jgi:hypothetical protein
VELQALHKCRINMDFSLLGTDGDFTISVLCEFCNTVLLTFSACRTFCKISVFSLKPLKTEMTNTMTTVHPQPHQDVLFLNIQCCNQHYSCQAILLPDVLNPLHNSIGGLQKTSYCSAPPHRELL